MAMEGTGGRQRYSSIPFAKLHQKEVGGKPSYGRFTPRKYPVSTVFEAG